MNRDISPKAMISTRPLRIATAMWVLIGLLFAQLAVAAYACPSLKTEQTVHQGMNGCAGMDKMQPNLCQAHDQAGMQSLDKPDVPSVHAFIPAAMIAVVETLLVKAGEPSTPERPLLARATAPPHSIQHCCFRI